MNTTLVEMENDNKEQWWKDFFLPPTPDLLPLAKGQRLIAIGDIHGRFCHLRDCLISSNLINDKYDDSKGGWYWIGGNAILVQVGDILDRGRSEESCIKLLTKLAQQAKTVGGAVIILWGNHEVCNATGDFICTYSRTTDFEETFGPVLDQRKATSSPESKEDSWRELYYSTCTVDNSLGDYEKARCTRFAAFEPGGPLSEPFLSNLKVAVQVGRTVFVHAGLTSGHVKEYGGIRGMNEAARKWILTAKIDPTTPGKDRLAALDATLPECFVGLTNTRKDEGPIFMRDYSNPPDRDPKQAAAAMIDDVLKELGADRLVVGHTVQWSGVNSVLEGKVWRVDVGDGIHFEHRNRSCLEDYMYRTKIALEVLKCEDGSEKVSVVERKH